jgi:hypothetical protein
MMRPGVNISIGVIGGQYYTEIILCELPVAA